MYFKVLDLDQTFILQPANKLDTYYDNMGETLARILNEFESRRDIRIFDTNKNVILSSYAKHGHSLFYYRFEKILGLYRDWVKFKTWKNPVVARKFDDNFLIHPGRDRWLVMKSIGVRQYNFMIVDHVSESVVNSIKSFWDDQQISIVGEGNEAHLLHDYNRLPINEKRNIKEWISSRLPLIEFLHK